MKFRTRQIIYATSFMLIGCIMGLMISLGRELPILLTFVWEQLATTGMGNLILLVIAILTATGGLTFLPVGGINPNLSVMENF